MLLSYIQRQCGAHGVNGLSALLHAMAEYEHEVDPVMMRIVLMKPLVKAASQRKLKTVTKTFVVSDYVFTDEVKIYPYRVNWGKWNT